ERIKEIMDDDNLKLEKTAIKEIYDEMILKSNLSRENLRKKTERARKAYFIFKELGIKEIKKIKEISMDKITRIKQEDIKEMVKRIKEKKAEKGKIIEMQPLFIKE